MDKTIIHLLEVGKITNDVTNDDFQIRTERIYVAFCVPSKSLVSHWVLCLNMLWSFGTSTNKHSHFKICFLNKFQGIFDIGPSKIRWVDGEISDLIDFDSKSEQQTRFSHLPFFRAFYILAGMNAITRY